MTTRACGRWTWSAKTATSTARGSRTVGRWSGPRTLQRIGTEEAERRVAAGADLHTGPTSDDPGALELQDCPVCGYEAFSSDGEDDLCMQVGPGECLVCHYRRSPAIANALGRDMWWEARGDRD